MKQLGVTRIEALMAILALPDEPCMSRDYRYTCARDPRRDPDVIKRDLGVAYVQHRRQQHAHGDVSCVVSVRRQPILKLARRA